MSGKIFKLIRGYAKLRGLKYKVCKKVYFSASLEDQKKFLKEMELAPRNDPVLQVHDRFNKETVEFSPRELQNRKLKASKK